MIEEKIQRAAELIVSSRYAVALTGAGVSTESGLPDFRSQEGLWRQYDPSEVATLSTFYRDPHKFYAFYRHRLALLREAKPNPAHYALARLEALGKLHVVVTQNVDGLHQQAGSQRVLEVHGNLREARCTGCGKMFPIHVLDPFLERAEIPTCDSCGSALKPNVVLFEELLPVEVFEEAEASCRRCDLLLVVGSSLQVTPVAYLPHVAIRHGARLILVNAEETPVDKFADVVLRGKAGVLLPRLVEEVERRLA
ncbi:MAG: NAD-dependent deacylase [Armatimonadota bacterium]|nr:NAD-dependent deacylase [Armatimonadota bacterium]MDR5703818.1 NAD-dependent deacylase [Armatimonadota bacterium]MDR7433770.1 NAD-dependent deacylase [Armatimonadota bacterium]